VEGKIAFCHGNNGLDSRARDSRFESQSQG
jgi:hypothetical protein